MKSEDRRKFLEYIENLIKENEAVIHNAKFPELISNLRKEIRAAKVIKAKLLSLEVFEG